MSFGSFDKRGSAPAMSEINMVPLIDVMLVLLVIFLITAPLLSHSIKVQLPQASAEPVEQEQKSIDLAIDAFGVVYVNDQEVAIENLTAHLAPFSQEKPQPELRIRADSDTLYEVLAQVMSKSKAAGMTRLGFVTRPDSRVAAPSAVTQTESGTATSASTVGSPTSQ